MHSNREILDPKVFSDLARTASPQDNPGPDDRLGRQYSLLSDSPAVWMHVSG